MFVFKGKINGTERSGYAFALVFLLISCAGANQAGNQAGKKSVVANAQAASSAARIVALGDSCKDTGVASTVPGVDARVALQFVGVDLEQYSIGYRSLPPSQSSAIIVNPNEAILSKPPAASSAEPAGISFEIIVRNFALCEGVYGANNALCKPNGGVVQRRENFDLYRKISFVVSASVHSYITGGLGTGGEGLISEVLQGKGLVSFLAKIGMVPNPNISAINDIADGANRQLDANKSALQNAPSGGCSREEQAQIGVVEPQTQSGAAEQQAGSG